MTTRRAPSLRRSAYRSALRCLALCLAAAKVSAVDWDGATWADYRPFIAPITPVIETRILAIADRGASAGRIAGRVGQYGDSISESYAFLRNVLAEGLAANETGHDYEPIITWIRDAYSGASGGEGDLGDHFGKGPDYGNKGGWTLDDLTQAGHAFKGADEGDGRDPGNYSWAIVMIGSNDIHRQGWKAMAWRMGLRALLLDLVDLGIVPVVSTIPPRIEHLDDERVEDANFHIRALAKQLSLPLVDYHGLITSTRPEDWHGTLLSDDGVHPSAGGAGRDFSRQGLEYTDGYAVRSKLILDVAEQLRPLLAAAYREAPGSAAP